MISQPELNLYRIIISQSRYGGLYEGGKWFAYSTSLNIPASFYEYLDGDDCDALDFWSGKDSENFVVGESPDETFAKLKTKQNLHGVDIDSETQPKFFS